MSGTMWTLSPSYSSLATLLEVSAEEITVELCGKEVSKKNLTVTHGYCPNIPAKMISLDVNTSGAVM